jgi:hypothetical protein
VPSSKAVLRILGITLGALLVLIGDDPAVEPVEAATSFDIVVEFDPTDDAIDPCEGEGLPTCGHDADLAAIMAAAATYWEDVIEDDHTMTVRYRWIADSDPSADVVTLDAAGRTTEGIIRIPAGRSYFYDPTPLDDDEFDMQVRLYRTVHPDEKTEAFDGAPIEVLEAGYIGLENQDQGADLFGQMLHEMGHLLGLNPDVVAARTPPPCTEDDDPYYHIDPDLAGGQGFALKAFEGSNGFDCAHLALGGITACKTDPTQPATSDEPSTFPPLTVQECTSHQALMWASEYPNARTKPSIADILAIATASGWEELNMPRKYSLATGPQDWAQGDSWLGGRIPDANDDVYIVNEEDNVEIDSYEQQSISNLTITSGNVLKIFSLGLFVEDDVIMRDAGTRITVDLGSTLDPFNIEIGDGSLLDVPLGGFVDSFYIDNNGEIRGAGSTIDVVVLENRGAIRGNGGLLSFTSSSIDKPFDLDGNAVDALLQATVGDLSFDGELTDSYLGRVEIGPGHFVTFADGWAQESSGNPAAQYLSLTGGAFEATVNGFSELNGLTKVDQIGRFTSDVDFLNFASVGLSLGSSTVPGTGHDQLRFDGSVSFAGALNVDLLPAFEQHVNDRYALMTYGDHTGTFATANLPALDGGLAFFLDYGDSQLDLVVGFEGATPGSPSCNGQVNSSQAAEHGGINNAAQFHGFPSVKAFKDAIKEFCDG